MSSKVKIFKNFLSKKDMKVLNKWTTKNKNNNFFSDAGMGIPGTRLTTRFSDPELFNFPEKSYEIQKKIIEFLGIEEFILPPFKDGIVSGVGISEGDIAEHIDPQWFKNTITLHCNVMTQKPISGGNLIVSGKKYEVDEGDLLCFDVSNQKHSVDKIVGDRERMLWVFGFCVSKDFDIWGEE